MEKVREEITQISRADRLDENHTRKWFGVLFCARPLNMNAIRAAIVDK